MPSDFVVHLAVSQLDRLQNTSLFKHQATGTQRTSPWFPGLIGDLRGTKRRARPWKPATVARGYVVTAAAALRIDLSAAPCASLVTHMFFRDFRMATGWYRLIFLVFHWFNSTRFVTQKESRVCRFHVRLLSTYFRASFRGSVMATPELLERQ